MTAFDDVKERVNITDVVVFYGFQPNQGGYICCPFHSERTPSCKLYDHSFHCYGCGAHGSVIDFVGQLYGLQPIDAVRKLNDDFHLGLVLDRQKPTAKDRKAAERRRTARTAAEKFDEWREETLRDLYAAFRAGNEAIAWACEFDTCPDDDAAGIRNQSQIDQWISVLSGSDVHAQMEIFRQRGEVAELCNKILKRSQRRS